MHRRVIAATELVLIFPAALFLTAVLARHLQLLQFAQEIVNWYSGRQWTLWVLLIGLPLGALLNGCIVLLGNSNDRTGEGQIAKHGLGASRTLLPTRIIAAATVAAGVILVVVVLHMLAN